MVATIGDRCSQVQATLSEDIVTAEQRATEAGATALSSAQEEMNNQVKTMVLDSKAEFKRLQQDSQKLAEDIEVKHQSIRIRTTAAEERGSKMMQTQQQTTAGSGVQLL